MARRRRTIYDRYLPQAQAEAVLRTSPERRGLRALLLEAMSQRDAAIHAAHTTSRVLRGAIREADPRVAAIYSQAGQGMSAVTGDYSHPASGVARDFAQLGPAAGSIAEAARAEAEAAQRRNIEAGTRARTELADEGTRAAAGEVAATRAAQDTYRADAAKVFNQLTGLDQEQGLFAATELGRLVDAARGRAVTKRGQTLSHKDRVASRRQSERASLRSSGIDPDTGKPIPGGKLDPKAKAKSKNWLPPGQQRSARKDFGAAKAAAQALKSTRSREEAAQIIMQGRPSIDLGGGVKTPPIKAVTDEALVSAALDMVYGKGYLSRQTQRRLHRNGVKVRQLGARTYGDYVRKRRQQNPTERGISQGALAGPQAPGY